MEKSNPFKDLESDAICPPHIKLELITEIDVIRNSIQVVELYVGDLLGLLSVLVDPTTQTPPNPITPP